jgi:hypothetical protein
VYWGVYGKKRWGESFILVCGFKVKGGGDMISHG